MLWGGAGCGVEGAGAPEPVDTVDIVGDTETVSDAQLEARRTPAPLDALFAQAAAEFAVPVGLLKAISYAETRWEMVESQPEFEGQPVVYGLMGIKGGRLEEAARLAGVDAGAVRSDRLANIRAAAALLAQDARALGVGGEDEGAWAPVVARYSGIADEGAQAFYVHQDVYGALRRGAVAQTPTGETAVSLLPRTVQPQFREPDRQVTAQAAGPDYAASVWRPSPNYNARPAGTDVSYLIIHTCEGSYTSCWSWLTNTQAGTSAHYVVNESGSEISQLVRESSRAWHVGASYSCSNNSSVDCGLNGRSVNDFSVGIEHGGYASQSSFPAGQIDASARLACDISRGQGIVRDRYHIVAHGQLQPYNRTDPGPNWPWSTYLSKINSYCGATSTGIIVDSNSANNNAANARIEVSANWVSATSTAGYYGTGYFYANTAAVSDGATFWFYLPAAGSRTIDAWWTAGTNRAPAAPFIAYNAAGTELGRVSANQQVNGGRWNALGTWNFSAGWNKVVLSRWTTSGYVVIADAVRIR
jgi:N-acetyl-anhydromuramyl-L-alanine amidase AmpD